MSLLYQPTEQVRLILSPDWKVSYFNNTISKSFLNLYGIPLSKEIFINDYIAPNLLPFFSESFQSALDGEEILRKKLIQIGEKEYWFQFSFYPLWDKEGDVTQILYTSDDVTDLFWKERKISELEKDRMKREEYLIHSEDKWRSLVESSPNIIYTLNKDFNFTYINYTISELKIQDIIGTNFLKYVTKEEEQKIKLYLMECLHRGTVIEFEILGSLIGEKKSWYTNRIAPIRNNLTNEIEALVGTAIEITEKKLAEYKVLESEERFRTMADNAPVMIWISGRDSLCNFFNKPWLDFTGRKMEEEIGLGWTEYLHPEDINSCMTTYSTAFQNRESFEIEYRLKRYDGEYRWILDRGIPLIISSGEFTGFIGSCIDITTRKQFENKIQSSLEEKEVLLKEIHHRVKNNLQIISSLLSLQSNQLDDPNIIEIFQKNIGRVKSIALIHDMLNLSPNQSKINFKEYLKLIGNYLLMLHENKSQEISLLINSKDIFISINIAIYIGLIVNELVSNSLKYAFPANKNGVIQIEILSESEKKLSLKVSDDGVGLPEEIEIDNVKSLGLKLVNTLTKQMKGLIKVNNDSGLTFEISIPMQEENNKG
ncbi:MAG: PAS domain S-box protein [Leptospiraceae bacterium]|nr:PAS domain S-box protein [Leptospiraceae bacterium]